MRLSKIEVYASARDLQIQILREELSIADVISYCIDESTISEVLDSIEEDCIVEYLRKKKLIKKEDI